MHQDEVEGALAHHLVRDVETSPLWAYRIGPRTTALLRDSPRMKRINVAGWLFVALVTLLVEVGVRAFDYEQSIATPSSTLRALVDEEWSGSLSGELGDTLTAYFQGLALAIVIGVAAGLLIGNSRTLLDATSVVIEFRRPDSGDRAHPAGTPGVSGSASLPSASWWRTPQPGRSCSTRSTASGASTACFTTSRGTSGVGRTGRLFRVTLPSALPSIATGIRVSAAIALLVCVTAEFFTTGGVGSYMQTQRIAYQLPEMYAAVVLVGLIGYLVNLGLRAMSAGRSSGRARSDR